MQVNIFHTCFAVIKKSTTGEFFEFMGMQIAMKVADKNVFDKIVAAPVLFINKEEVCRRTKNCTRFSIHFFNAKLERGFTMCLQSLHGTKR